MSATLPTRFLSIDEEGYALTGEIRMTDIRVGGEILENLSIAENGALISESGGQSVLIEAFDEPLVAKQVDREGNSWSLLFPYEHRENFDPASLRLDEWDRFHGRTERGIPFVLSRSAQASFFDLIDDSDDDSITIDGKQIPVPGLFQEAEIAASSDWSEIYQNEKPRWDLGEAAEPLKDMLPRLKLPKCRVLVPGCGLGHDAAYFAREGHVVTAIDFSDEALAKARELYGHLPNLRFEKADIFKLGNEHRAAYDLIFEHTCFCAVDPLRRRELVRLWTEWLAPGGQFMGIFFAVNKSSGPPFGGSEWEMRERLRKYFRFLFWGRWQKSPPRRQGKELFVFASKL